MLQTLPCGTRNLARPISRSPIAMACTSSFRRKALLPSDTTTGSMADERRCPLVVESARRSSHRRSNSGSSEADIRLRESAWGEGGKPRRQRRCSFHRDLCAEGSCPVPAGDSPDVQAVGVRGYLSDYPTIRLALRMILLTLVRKSEL